MENALIISSAERGVAFFTDILGAAAINNIVALSSCGEARRLLLVRDFDLVIINAPIADETGEALSRHIASKGLAQVILAAPGGYFGDVSAACENDGVLLVQKPVDKAFFWSVLKLAWAAQSRASRADGKAAAMGSKLEEIRLVDRAKCLLISDRGMTEQQAHRYVIKQSMNLRATKRAVAEGIIRMYEKA